MNQRINIIRAGFLLLLLVVISRLFYWQIIAKDELTAIAVNQRNSTVEIPSQRGQILASDGFPLVTNQPSYLVFAYLPAINQTASEIARQLAPILAPTPQEIDATPSAQLAEKLVKDTEAELIQKLDTKSAAWIPLRRKIDETKKNAIEALQINGLGFESGQDRLYPEASMAAQLLGFVGTDSTGNPKGYFGIEGYYDLELKGKSGFISQERDASGRPIIVGSYQGVFNRDGRTLKTTVDRGIQLKVEKRLQKAIEKYGAKAGEVLIIEPQTGKIVAMAATPGYDQSKYREFDTSLYKIGSIANTYEPGSTFKAVVMAMALEEGAITPDTRCDKTCDGPVAIGPFTINTALKEYNPGQTMTRTLELSDNTGMVFAAFKLGKENFVKYLEKFGFTKPTGIDLEQETVPKYRERWGDIDLATGSFGQGLTVTSLHLLQVIAAFANDGVMMRPHVVSEVIGDRTQKIEPKVVDRIISSDTAAKISTMMESAAHNGLPSWMLPEGYRVAGKTGTAQVPIAGHYDTSTTIHSYVGFAPVKSPRFAMVVKLQEPTFSPWASTTAAPLWMEIASDLLNHYGIPPEKP